MPTSSRYVLARAAGIAATGTLLFAFDRILLRTGTSPLDARGLFVLWAGHVLAAAGLALLGLVWRGLHRASGLLRRPRSGFGPPFVAGLLLALGGAAPLFVVSLSLVSGDWIARQWFAPAVKFAATGAGMVGLLGLGWLYARSRVRSPALAGVSEAPSLKKKRPFVLPVLLGLGAVVLAAADGRVLPGLYPELHFLLYGLSALLALLAACRTADLVLTVPRARTVAGAAGGVLVAVAIAGVLIAGPGARSRLARGSRVAALVVPFLPVESHVIEEELAVLDMRDDKPAAPTDARAAVDRLLGGRRDYNVLIVIVDTLRADTLPPTRGDGKPHAATSDTPFLNDWLAKSYRFRHAYSQASRTRRSIPPTFRSLEANEDVLRIGTPLGTQASELGFLPVAVVPQYFLLPESEEAKQLLIGFDRAAFYEKDHQEVLIDRARDMFESLKGQRFLGWIHFYNMHDPYFTGRLSNGADGTTAQRYQKALRWLDTEMKKLVEALEQAGLGSNTVVFFTADHGENLGDEGRTGHGATVYEPDVHVPLSVHVPGQAGGDIDTGAGNVDIVPTVLDLAGAPPQSTHRGRSLLPLLAGAEKASVPLYFENSSGATQGVAIGTQKLIRTSAGTFYRFDVGRDPGEDDDLYDPEGEIDRALRREMLRKSPKIFASELKRSAVLERLVRRLAEVGAGASVGPNLDLLLQLAALSKNDDALAQGERIFKNARDTDVALLAVKRLYASDPKRWSGLVGKRLVGLAGKPQERAFVEGLALQGQAAFAHADVAARLGALAMQPPEVWTPWLGLIRSWKKPQELYAAPLESLLATFPTGARTADDTQALMLLLECSGTLVPGADPEPAQRVATVVQPWLDDPDPKVAVAAARALGNLHDTESSALFREKLADPDLDVRVRQALIYAVAAVEGAAAAPLVMKQGENPFLTVDAMQILGEMKAESALPFLRKIARSHFNGYTREEAKKAIARIEGTEDDDKNKSKKGKGKDRGKGKGKGAATAQPTARATAAPATTSTAR